MPLEQPLVGAFSTQQPQVWAITQGGWRPARRGGHRPDKFWGFRIGRSGEKDPRTKQMPIDTDATRALYAAAGFDPMVYNPDDEWAAPKVLAVPIYLWSNSLFDALYGTRAAYNGRRRFCWCGGGHGDGGGFRLKGAEDLERDGLEWPEDWPPVDAINALDAEPPEELLNDEKWWHGVARRNDLWGYGKVAPRLLNPERNRPKWELRCDPTTCPLATGAHGIEKYAGNALCKPDVRLYCKLNFGEYAGQYAKFRTTGRNSWRVLGSTWRDRYLECGRTIVNVPLLLAIGKEPRAAPTGKEVRDIPVARLDFDGTPQQARLAAAAQMALLEKGVGLEGLSQARALVKALPAMQHEQEEVSSEFHPDTDRSTPAWELELRALMREKDPSISEAAMQAEVDEAMAGDPEAALHKWGGWGELGKPEGVDDESAEDADSTGATEPGAESEEVDVEKPPAAEPEVPHEPESTAVPQEGTIAPLSGRTPTSLFDDEPKEGEHNDDG